MSLIEAYWTVVNGRAERVAAPGRFRVYRNDMGRVVVETFKTAIASAVRNRRG